LVCYIKKIENLIKYYSDVNFHGDEIEKSIKETLEELGFLKEK